MPDEFVNFHETWHSGVAPAGVADAQIASVDDGQLKACNYPPHGVYGQINGLTPEL
jgi:hypothetical protein